MEIHASSIGVQEPAVAQVTITGNYGDTTNKAMTKAEALELAADLIHYATQGNTLADQVRDMARRADAEDTNRTLAPCYWTFTREAMDALHAEALQEDAEREIFDQNYRWAAQHNLPSGRREHIDAAIEVDHAAALTENAYRTELQEELRKFATGQPPYPYIPVNHGEQPTRLVDKG